MNGCHYRLFSIVCGPPLSLAGPSLIKSDDVLRQCFANPWNTPTMLQEASMWLTARQWLTLHSEPLALQQAARCCGDFIWAHKHVANNTAIIDCLRQWLVFTLSCCQALCFWQHHLTPRGDTRHLKISWCFLRGFYFIVFSRPAHFRHISPSHYFHNMSEMVCSGLFSSFFPNVGWKSIGEEQSPCKGSLTGIPDLLTSTTLM